MIGTSNYQLEHFHVAHTQSTVFYSSHTDDL